MSANNEDGGKTGGCDKPLNRFRQTDNRSEILSPGATLVFVSAAEDKRIGTERRFNEREPAPFGP